MFPQTHPFLSICALLQSSLPHSVKNTLSHTFPPHSPSNTQCDLSEKKKKYNHISIKSKGRLWGVSSLAFLGSSARLPTLCSEGLMHLTSSSPRERLQQVLTLCVLYSSVWGCFLLSFPVWLDWLSPHSVLSSHGLGSFIPSLVLCSFTSSLIKAVHLMLVRLMGQNRLCNSYKGYLPRVSGPRVDFLPLTHLQWL